MQYTKAGVFYRVSRITGPTHNLLGLSFSGEEPKKVVAQKLSEPESGSSFDEEQLKRAVALGVNQENFSLGTHYHVEGIQYIPTDTQDLEIYSFLARSLIEEFVHTGEPSLGQSRDSTRSGQPHTWQPT
jgi:hypothetical protein